MKKILILLGIIISFNLNAQTYNTGSSIGSKSTITPVGGALKVDGGVVFSIFTDTSLANTFNNGRLKNLNKVIIGIQKTPSKKIEFYQRFIPPGKWLPLQDTLFIEDTTCIVFEEDTITGSNYLIWKCGTGGSGGLVDTPNLGAVLRNTLGFTNHDILIGKDFDTYNQISSGDFPSFKTTAFGRSAYYNQEGIHFQDGRSLLFPQGLASNKTFLTTVRLNGTDYNANSSGLADLGTISSGASLFWYDENNTAPTTAPVASGAGSIALGDGAKALSPNMFVYGNGAGENSTNSQYSNFIGYNSGINAINASRSNFIGYSAGYNSEYASFSNFIGANAGSNVAVIHSNFIGANAGENSTNSQYSNFIGSSAGNNATNAQYSNFIGADAGGNATNAPYSNFIGRGSGNNATNAQYSNFIGEYAGFAASNASYSNLFGLKAGMTFLSNNIGSNNIIIGTNISLPNGTANSMNIGGVLFGTGFQSNIIPNPFTTPIAGGKIGIGNSTPSYKLTVQDVTNPLQLIGLEDGNVNDKILTTDAGGVVRKVTGMVFSKYKELPADPTISDIPDGYSGVFRNTTSGNVYLWTNVGGTLLKVQLL